jgi:hypothetical protein
MCKMTKEKNSISEVSGVKFPYGLADNKGYARQNGLKGLKLLKFWASIYKGYREANKKLEETFKKKACYYGPFKGEFGHFTAHTLPFLMYLHKHNVQITYCGLEIHKPLLIDENGNSIVTKFYALRDFFHEVSPNSNSVIPPKDVQEEINKFEREAEESGLPFWDIGNDFYYWFIHRNWLGKGHTHLYDLSKYYKTADENAVCIFPRNKGSKSSFNNGDAWDYEKLIELINPFFDKIYVVGHPSQSLSIPSSEKVEIRITADNAKILEACSNSRLIITQHSGVNNLGEYVRKQVLIIYKGGNKISDIGSMNNTLRFRGFMKEKLPLNFAFSEDEVVNYAKNLTVK